MFMPRKDVGSKILSFVMIDYLEMQSLDNYMEVIKMILHVFTIREIN